MPSGLNEDSTSHDKINLITRGVEDGREMGRAMTQGSKRGGTLYIANQNPERFSPSIGSGSEEKGESEESRNRKWFLGECRCAGV